MVDALKDEFPEIELVLNKQVDGGCSAHRPDVRIEMFTHTVIVECDENRHQSAGYDCENKRLMQLFENLGSRPMVVIRFNPDTYEEDGNRVPGCFLPTATSLAIRSGEWARRIEVLAERIRHHHAVPDRELTIEYLFYE